MRPDGQRFWLGKNATEKVNKKKFTWSILNECMVRSATESGWKVEFDDFEPMIR